MKVRINEAFRDYSPPFNAKAVRKLLAAVPEKYLRDLDCAVLTNYAALPRKERTGTLKARKRKVEKSKVRGLYHGEWHGNPAWIELRVDQTIRTAPKAFLWIPLIHELYLGVVLYHELGHHIHACVRPEHREKEDVADNWSGKLAGIFLRRKYWWLVWPLLFVHNLCGIFKR